MPRGGARLWRIYLDLNACRRGGFAGPEPISYSDIDAYQRTTGEILEPWEVGGVRALDAVAIEEWVKNQDAATKAAAKGS